MWVSQATGLDFEYFKLREWYVGIKVSQATELEFEWLQVSKATALEFE